MSCTIHSEHRLGGFVLGWWGIAHRCSKFVVDRPHCGLMVLCRRSGSKVNNRFHRMRRMEDAAMCL
uniref:Uncharacterized protein n=1 Tax=Zea mays TaxID=4577 RepID=B6U1Q7_MAIZE|nr:hypothetical protein [Zea mays]